MNEPDRATGTSRRTWLIAGLVAAALLLVFVFTFGATVLLPMLRNRPPAAPAAAGDEADSAAAPGPLTVTATTLPEMHRDKKFQFIDSEELREQFKDRDFTELDAYYQEQLATRLDYDSRYNLSQCVLQLGKIRSGTERRLQAWARKLPRSHLPHLLLARWHIKKAWQSRGGGWSNTVTDSGWQGFRRHLASAERQLRIAYDLNPADPNIGAMGVTVAMGQGSNTEDQWFARAMAADPYHSLAHNNLMYARYPKWGGSWELARAVVETALDKTDSNPQLFLLLPAWYNEYIKRTTDRADSVARDAVIQQMYDDNLGEDYARAAARFPAEFSIHAAYAIAALEACDTHAAFRAYANIIPRWERGEAMPWPYEDKFDPSVQMALKRYAWLLATDPDPRNRNPARALAYAKQAVAMDTDDEWALDSLGCAYAAGGDFARAIATLREARRYGNAAYQRHCDMLIARYQRREPPRW